jgi:hypothetical protein
MVFICKPLTNLPKMAAAQYERPLGFWLLCALSLYLMLPWSMAINKNVILAYGILMLYVTNAVILSLPRFTAEEGRPFAIFFAYFISLSVMAYSVLYDHYLFAMYYYPIDVIGPTVSMLCGCALISWIVAGLMTVREDHWISALKPYRRLVKQLQSKPLDPLACVLVNDPKFTTPVYYFPPPPPPVPTYYPASIANPQIIY